MTAQAPESLILDGKKTSMTFCPPLPFGDPRFGGTREALALKTVAARIAMDLLCFEDEAEKPESLDLEDLENLKLAARPREARVDAFRAKRIADALEAATDKMPETYYAGETPLPKRTTVEELSAAVDLACQERPALLVHNSGWWRGYHGTWEIRENRFYLVEVTGTPSYTGRPPILADWFTGVLRIPRGKILDYWHMGFASQYEAELHIQVDRGVVKERRLLSARDLASGMDLASMFAVGLPGTENRFPGDGSEIEGKFPLEADPGAIEDYESFQDFAQWDLGPDDLDLAVPKLKKRHPAE